MTDDVSLSPPPSLGPYDQTADDDRLNCTPVDIQYLSIDSMVHSFVI